MDLQLTCIILFPIMGAVSMEAEQNDVVSPHDFVFGLFPKKILYQLDVVHAYKLIILSIPI